MKKKVLFIIVLFLLVSYSVFGAPFLVSDPNPGITVTRLNIPALSVINRIDPANPDGSVYIDIAFIPEGEYSGTVEAGDSYVLDNQGYPVYRWSDPTPFVLKVPGAVTGAALRLSGN